MSSCTPRVKTLLAITLFINAWLLFLPGSSLADIKSDKELVFFNWSDYFDPELMAKFEQQYQVKVRQAYFDNDDIRTDILVEKNTEGYDVVIVDTPSLSLYRKAGWLEKIDTNQVPNYRYIDQRWIDAAGDDGEYTVPFFWGTLGIAYRKDLVSTPPDKWMDLYRPEKSLQGKIGMHRNTVDLVGTALKALSYSMNDTNSATLDQVERLLREQKPYVHTYDYLSLEDESAIVTGEITAGMFYSGDALMVMEHDENIEYVLPSEGSMIWIDHMVVMKSSKHKELAWQFINFVNDPENAAQLAEWVYSATPNLAAEKLLPDEFLQDPVIYPDKNALSKSEFNHSLPARIVKKRSRIVSQVTE
jgi:spermidine/putrescine transport system substrate-binding protein